MATVDFMNANRVRIYRDGAYILTLTSANNESTQNTVERKYIGDDDTFVIATTKEYKGTFNRDMISEEFLELLLNYETTTKFAVSDYDDYPDTVKFTVTNVSANHDLTFTTPTNTALVIDGLRLNVKRVGRFEGGLVVEIWQGTAGSGTLKATFTADESELDTNAQSFIDLTLDPEASEVALVSNTSHQMRIKKAGTVTGSLQLYGPSAATTEYYAILYETTDFLQGNYTIDMVFADSNNVEYMTIRDTGVTFLSDGMTINPGEPIGEVIEWRAKDRTIV